MDVERAPFHSRDACETLPMYPAPGGVICGALPAISSQLLASLRSKGNSNFHRPRSVYYVLDTPNELKPRFDAYTASQPIT